MEEYTATQVQQLTHMVLHSSLEKLLREGARKMLQAALELEVDEYIELSRGTAAAAGRQVVVRNGRHPQRELVSGIGKLIIRQPRVHDRREGHPFTSAILPPYLRRTPSLEALIRALYLKGLSTSCFPEALQAILGDEAGGLSAANVVRLKKVWEGEFTAWQKRDLTGKRYVYVWADGICFNVRLEPERPCLLVLIGATAEGKEEKAAPDGGDATWVGFGLQPVYHLSKKVCLGARFEHFKDSDGARTPDHMAQTLQNISIAPAYCLTKNLVSRVEFRSDMSDMDVYTDGDGKATGTQMGVTAEMIYSF